MKLLLVWTISLNSSEYSLGLTSGGDDISNSILESTAYVCNGIPDEIKSSTVGLSKLDSFVGENVIQEVGGGLFSPKFTCDRFCTIPIVTWDGAV